MAFVHPALLATAGGLALLPLVIHLLSRRGYRSEPWAAMMFLASAQQAAKRRLRVERWLLLVVRTLVVLLLGLAIARPLASGSALGDAIAKPRFDRVIVLDDSVSMQAIHADGKTSFDAARALARRIIEESEPRDGLALVAASRPPKAWMDRPMHDRQALRAILDGWTCTSSTDDVQGALRQASEMLGRGQAASGCRLVYWITDQTRASFDAAVGPAMGGSPKDPWPGIDRLFVLNVGPERRENVGIASFSAASQIVGVGIPARFTVRTANHGSHRIEQMQCEVSLDGAVVQRRGMGPLEPRGETSEDFDLVFNSDGAHRVVAQLKGAAGDVLPADDVRYLAVQVDSGLSVLAVEGLEDARKTSQELFYYSAAVSTRSPASETGGVRVKTVAPIELESEVLGDYAVVVLGNVRRLPDETWRRIERFVRAGGGLFLTLGDRIQADHYNEMAVGRCGLLPFQLWEATAATESVEPWEVRINEPRHLALADLAGSDRGGLGVAQIRAFWRIRLPSSAHAPRVLIRLSNDEPLLMESDVGRGRVLAWLTSANMAWNNLPAKPDNVPLMVNLTLYAARGDRATGDLAVLQPIVHAGSADEVREAGTVLRPDGQSVKVEWTTIQSAPAIVYDQTDRPGFYIVSAGPDRAFAAVNVDPRESDLTTAEGSMLRERLGPDVNTVAGPGDVVAQLNTKPPREMAPLFMVLLLVLVSVETILAMLFGGRT